MPFTIEEVKLIAHLARLNLTVEEEVLFQEQLSDILDYVARLQELDTKDIPPTSSVLPSRTVLREDEPRSGLDNERLMQNAPDREKRQFKVPPILP